MTDRVRRFRSPRRCVALLLLSVLFVGHSAKADPLTSGWKQIRPSGPVPAPRLNVALAYDPDAGLDVLFGGWTINAKGYLVPSNDTWTWNGTTWKRMRPRTSPPARSAAAMTYDPVHHLMVLFGGSEPGIPFASDTWVWNGVNWAQVRTPTHPSGRVFAAMAFDDVRGRVLLFGGDEYWPATYSRVLNDTWSFDGSKWKKLAPATSPSARATASMADLPGRGIMLFGGRNRQGSVFGDTWLWNGDTWSSSPDRTNPTQTPPRAVAAPRMAYDGAGCIVLQGGQESLYLYPQTYTSAGVMWSAQQGGPRLAGAAMAQAPGGGVLVFGGGDRASVLNDMWLWTSPVDRACL